MLHGIRRILAILVFVLLTLGMNTSTRAQQTPMTITYEQTIQGSLDTTDPALSDGSHHSDEYIFQAEAGKSYQITVKSDAFAAEVYVFFSNADYILQGAYVIRPRDQVQFSGTLEQSGQHTIKVTTSSWEPSALGSYTLTLSEGQPPGPQPPDLPPPPTVPPPPG